MEPESVLSLRLLAAHIYHRALLTVPALIRAWISDCSDRQLLSRVVDYTASYFSPGIIRAELAQVRRADSSSELHTTENLVVKVSPSAGEVTASYTVDDQVLELSLRLPNDWPLHRLDIRDTKMVGVSEERWRGWVLGVQQIVWQQVSDMAMINAGPFNESYTERSDCRRPDFIHEECDPSFRRSSGVCNLLLVRKSLV